MNIFNFVKSQLSILDVVNSYATMKKAGHYWKGHCPFHSEKTASFTVSPDKEIFYCFGCHEGGDVISFIAKVENCSPLEAVKLLADRYHLELPEQISYESDLKEKKHYLDLCQTVATWCYEKLLKSPFVISYCLRRGISRESIKRFQIGYFPGGLNNINLFLRAMAMQNILAEDLIQANILFQGKTVLYSPFEDRLIFPITDHVGRFCGFGGRIFKKNDTRAKYYNSRENEHFVKGALLFGLELAKKEIQKTDQVFLVEGYTDCIAMAQAGYANTVATLGTSCTLEHLKRLSRFASSLYTLYDGDKAGTQAIIRLAELCWQVNIELWVISLPRMEDPASFLVTHNSIDSYIENAPDIFQFYIGTLSQNFEKQPLSKKLVLTRRIISIIAHIADPLARDILLQKAASQLGIPFETIQREVFSTKPKPKTEKIPSVNAQVQEGPIEPATRPFELQKVPKLEKKLFFAILNNIQLFNKENVKILTTYLPKPFCNILYTLKQAKCQNSSLDFAQFFSQLDTEKQQLVSHLLLEQDQDGNPDMFEHLLAQLQKKHWKAQVGQIKMKLETARNHGDQEQVTALLKEFIALKNKLIQNNFVKNRDK